MPTKALEQMKADVLMAMRALGLVMMMVEKFDGSQVLQRTAPYTSGQATVSEYASLAKDHWRVFATNRFAR